MAWAPDYVEVDDLREYVTSSTAQIDADEAQFPRAIAAASRAIDQHCRRQFGLVAAPEVRYYRPRYSSRRGAWVVDIDDLMSTLGLLVAGEVPLDPVLHPRNAAAEGRPWTELVLDDSCDEVAVTARWGWTSVPVAVEQACLLQASRLCTRRSAPFGIAGSPESGSEMRLLAKVDPDVAVSLGPYRKMARPR